MTYPSDLTDDQWQRLEPLLPAQKPGGRTRRVDLRAVCNAIFVDSLGQVMKVVVTEANGSERVGALYGLMAWTEQYPEL